MAKNSIDESGIIRCSIKLRLPLASHLAIQSSMEPIIDDPAPRINEEIPEALTQNTRIRGETDSGAFLKAKCKMGGCPSF